MSHKIRIEQFTDKNIADYDQVKKEDPERLKACVIDRMRSQFHVGVIAYIDDQPAAWISVGPITDFFWAWRRVGQVGDIAKTTAGIMCFTIAPEFRYKGFQNSILAELKKYGAEKAWTSIEAYPFSNQAIEKHGDALKWPGLTGGYEKAGYVKAQNHWLSSPEAERYIYKMEL